MGVDDGSPSYDRKRSTDILLLYCAPNITKLAIFKHNKMLSNGNVSQPSDCPFCKIGDDVSVGFQQDNRVSNFFGKLDELVGGGHVSRNTQVALLDDHQAQEIDSEGMSRGKIGTVFIGLGARRVFRKGCHVWGSKDERESQVSSKMRPKDW